MGKDKLKRFSEVERLENVFEYTDYSDEETPKPKGRWRDEVFGNSNPVTLELACGKGEYAIALALMHPERNFVGVDIKGARIWKGAKKASEEGISNVRFLRIFIDHLAEYFDHQEVDEIWITFPDPYLKNTKTRKRLTSPKFLDIYRKLLKPGGQIHLKTDSTKLFEFTLKTIENGNCELVEKVYDVYNERKSDKLLTIKTFYEKGHLEKGKTIHYVTFRLH